MAGLAILVWLAVAAMVSPLAAKLAGQQQNDNALFLPSQAESTRVLKQVPAFENSAVLPAIVVYERRSGLTAADRDLVAEQSRRIGSIRGVVGRVPPPIPSTDGRAVEVLVPLDGARFDRVSGEVERLRAATHSANGLSVHVAGPAGLAADFGAAFKALDVKLLVGTSIVVVAVLLIVYRSPFLWLIPLLGVGFSLVLAQALVYVAGRQGWFSSNGQSQGILTVLVFGAGTDYALLIISRYREELRRHPAAHTAIQATLRGTAPAVLASGTTVIVSLLCLLLASDGANRSLGPTAAIGIA
ncbi:MAG TPA: MMPL family transporter, partial [Candidatus Dormibacteraeota bacterium]|nr:MMPL family transporter [Candidatus Dormibacteraeota bacterium]